MSVYASISLHSGVWLVYVFTCKVARVCRSELCVSVCVYVCVCMCVSTHVCEKWQMLVAGLFARVNRAINIESMRRASRLIFPCSFHHARFPTPSLPHFLFFFGQKYYLACLVESVDLSHDLRVELVVNALVHDCLCVGM